MGVVRRDILDLIPVWREEHLLLTIDNAVTLVHPTGPVPRGQGETNERGGHYRLVGGRFKNKRTYFPGLSWVTISWVNLCACPQESSVYIEALTGFSLTHHPNCLKNTLLSQDCVLKSGSHGGQSVLSLHGGEGKEPQVARVQVLINQWSHPLNDLF